MGRYFGIRNKTKKQIVSSYWKGDEWCDCYQVMHQLHWEKTDDIYSSCYDTICEFKYDVEDDVMECMDVTENLEQKYNEKMVQYCEEFHKCHHCDKCNECIICYNCECEENENEDDWKCNFSKDTNNSDCKSNCICKCDKCNGSDKLAQSDIKQSEVNIKYGFDETMREDNIYESLHHVPDWMDGNICRKCNYKYDDTLLDKYKQNFDGTYCMN